MYQSTELRYRQIVELYERLIKEEGERAAYLDRSYFFDKIEDALGVSQRTISRALKFSAKRQRVK